MSFTRECPRKSDDNFPELIAKYFRLGWRVIPLSGKVPVIPDWTNAWLTKSELQNWIERGCNVGIVTGWTKQDKLALVALDVDEPKLLGFDCEAWINRGAMAHVTGTGFRIVFYTDSPELVKFSRKVIARQSDLSEEDKKLLVKGADRETITILEVLGEGRQFMAPPSIHPETGKKLEWIKGPSEPRDCLIVHSLEELKHLLTQSVGLAKWVVGELFEPISLNETKEDTSILQHWLEKILAKLRPRYARDTPQYYLFRCPFHGPDLHPSFAIHKRKFYAIDYHDARIYSMRELAQILGLELTKAEVKVVLGHHTLKVRGGNVIVYNDEKPMYAISLNSLTGDRAKKRLAQYLGIDLNSVEQVVAQIVDRLGTFKSTKRTETEEVQRSRFAEWRRILNADMD